MAGFLFSNLRYVESIDIGSMTRSIIVAFQIELKGVSFQQNEGISSVVAKKKRRSVNLVVKI